MKFRSAPIPGLKIHGIPELSKANIKVTPDADAVITSADNKINLQIPAGAVSAEEDIELIEQIIKQLKDWADWSDLKKAPGGYPDTLTFRISLASGQTALRLNPVLDYLREISKDNVAKYIEKKSIVGFKLVQMVQSAL